MAKIFINREEGISCGACWSTSPEVYEQNMDDSKSQIVSELRVDGNNAVGMAEGNLAEKAQQGADSCPIQIITVE